MKNRKRIGMAAAVIMAGSMLVFPTQAAGIEEQTTEKEEQTTEIEEQTIEREEQTAVQNELEESGISKQGTEVPELLSIDGTEMKLGEVLSLPGGGTAELVRDESTQKLVLNLKDAVIGKKEELLPIRTMESLLIRVQGNCTISGENVIGYFGSGKCQVTLEEVQDTNAVLTVNTKDTFILGISELFNHCDLQINVNAEELLTRFNFGSDLIENEGNISIEVQNETEDSFGTVTCKTVQNHGTFYMQEAEGKDEYDLVIEKLVLEEGSQLTVEDGVEIGVLDMSGGTIEAESSLKALDISEKFEMTGGEIRAIGGRVGLHCGDSMSAEQIPVSITNGKIVAEAKDGTGRGMEVVNSNLTIQGGEYQLKGGVDYYGALKGGEELAGLSLSGTEAVIGDCKLEASGGIGIAQNSSLRGGDLTIAPGAEIHAVGALSGIYVYDANLVIQGGTVKAEAKGEEEVWAPIVTQVLWFDDTTEEEKQEAGHILLSDGITCVNGAKGMSVQGRTIEEENETITISRYFEFLGTSESSIQTKEMNDPYIHYEYKNIPFSVEVTDSHEHEYSAEGEIIKPATNETEGIIRYYCNTCGGYRDEVIPKLSGQTSNEGDNDSQAEISKGKKTSKNPQTGDKAFPAMWAMLGSIAAITGIVEYKSRKMSK